jgi:transposase
MRIARRTVGAIVARVWVDIDALADRLDGLRRIGVDEISYKRGYRYLTVVVDHDTGRLLWAAPGRDRATLRTFFDTLGPQRSALITHVSADQADWVAEVVTERCRDAVQCADPFHIVKWATEALGEVRRQAWNDARRHGPRINKGRGRQNAAGDARALKHARYALWKNPEVRHEAPSRPGGDERTPPLARRSGLVEAEGSPTAETRGRVGAALTTTGRVGTTRRPGSGKRDEKVYERNQCQSPVSLPPAQTWWMRAGLQRTLPPGSDSVLDSSGSRRRPWGRSAAYPGRCCRDIAGRLTRQPGGGERGNRHESPSCPAIQVGSGQVRRRLTTRARGGGSVVVRGRESRPHGKGTQQVRSLGVGRPGGRP